MYKLGATAERVCGDSTLRLSEVTDNTKPPVTDYLQTKHFHVVSQSGSSCVIGTVVETIPHVASSTIYDVVTAAFSAAPNSSASASPTATASPSATDRTVAHRTAAGSANSTAPQSHADPQRIPAACPTRQSLADAWALALAWLSRCCLHCGMNVYRIEVDPMSFGIRTSSSIKDGDPASARVYRDCLGGLVEEVIEANVLTSLLSTGTCLAKEQ